MIIPPKDQRDRYLVKRLRPGKTYSLGAIKSLSKPVLRMLDRKLAKHGWTLEERNSGVYEVVEK